VTQEAEHARTVGVAGRARSAHLWPVVPARAMTLTLRTNGVSRPGGRHRDRSLRLAAEPEPSAHSPLIAPAGPRHPPEHESVTQRARRLRHLQRRSEATEHELDGRLSLHASDVRLVRCLTLDEVVTSFEELPSGPHRILNIVRQSGPEDVGRASDRVLRERTSANPPSSSSLGIRASTSVRARSTSSGRALADQPTSSAPRTQATR